MKKVIIFLFVGGSSALIDVGSLYLLTKILFVNNELSVSISFLLGLLFNYFCHTYFTFNNKATSKNLVKYLIVVLINYFLTIILIYLMRVIGLDIVIAKIITLPIVAIITFLLSTKWVYR